MRTSKAYARTIKNQNQYSSFPTETEVSAKQVEKRIEKIGKFQTVGDTLAQDKLVYLNWYWPQGKEKFPHDSQMWFVNRYYPYAIGGPLLIDEPKTSIEIERSEKKREALEDSGFRFYVIDHKKTIEEMVFEVGGL